MFATILRKLGSIKSKFFSENSNIWIIICQNLRVSSSCHEPFSFDSHFKIWNFVKFVKFEKSTKLVKSSMFATILRKIGSIKSKFFSENSNIWIIICQNLRVSSSCHEPFPFDSHFKIWSFVKFEKSTKLVKSPKFATILRKIGLIKSKKFSDN